MFQTCSNSLYSVRMFRLQGKILRTVTSSKNRDSCRNLFKNLNIFSFISQYIFSLLSLSLLTANNILQIKKFMAEVPNMAPIFTEQYHSGPYHAGLKVFNSLPTCKKEISCYVKELKLLLKNCLHLNSFYTWRSICNIKIHSLFYS